MHDRRQPSRRARMWGFLPAFFKAKWNTNETLFTLMMNYIATQLAAFFIIVWEVPKGSRQDRHHQPEHARPAGCPVIGGNQYLLNILVVAVLTVRHVRLPQLQQARL